MYLMGISRMYILLIPNNIILLLFNENLKFLKKYFSHLNFYYSTNGSTALTTDAATKIRNEIMRISNLSLNIFNENEVKRNAFINCFFFFYYFLFIKEYYTKSI